MSAKKLSWVVRDGEAGRRLDHVLAEWLPEALGRPVSRAAARKLIVAGAVYLNGRRVRIASKPLLARARVEAHVDEAKLFAGGTAEDRPFAMGPERILFEDEWLIAVDKPPGLPTQPTLDEARDNLFASLKRFLAARDGVAQPYLGLHHRLDRDTSGVILLTKRTEANAGIAEAFAGRKAEKVYQALARRGSRAPGAEWTVENYLARAPGAGKRGRFASVRAGGDPARTEFRLLEELPGALWVEARPRTGRTHQIRVHLAEAGMPILGDATYGDRESAPRLMLHAAGLTFTHPVTNLDLSIRSPLPEDFSQCLRHLRAARAGRGS
jgi:RluA family pseudouridine synthase